MKRHTIRTPRIVQSNQVGWLPKLLAPAALLVIIGGAIYLYSDTKSGCTQAEFVVAGDDEVGQLRQKIVLLEKERDEYRLQAAKYERASQIDREVVSTVQVDLKTLQEERADLRQQVEFLKSLVSGDITSLQLSNFKIDESGKKHTYDYSLTISKRAKGKDKVRGNLILSVIGKLAGKKKTLRMRDLSLDAQDLKMGFQNFQHYKGTLKLPEKFQPELFRVKVVPDGGKFKSFEKNFPWQLKKANSNIS